MKLKHDQSEEKFSLGCSVVKLNVLVYSVQENEILHLAS
jgi:hypothetical protein